jgi:hypothetical protein
MPNPTEQANLPKIRRLERSATNSGGTPLTAWTTVVLGGIILADNVLELGGVVPTSQELTAGFLAVMLIVHGVSLAWERGKVDDAAGLRLPRWPLWALPFVFWLGYMWWQDAQAPWASRETFFLAVQAWLLCWVVAATPGGRVLSWAWLLTVGAVAALAFVFAVVWQRGGNALWLPLGRELPEAWAGRWSGTLPTPGAFGGLMILGAAPLLVMAFSRRMGVEWRIGIGYVGFMLLIGALRSNSLGAWMGVGFTLVLLPVVVGGGSTQRLGAWAALMVIMLGFGLFLVLSGRIGVSGYSLFTGLQAGEPSLQDAWTGLRAAWEQGILQASRGEPFSTLSLAGGATGAGGGLNYGFSDWLDLATEWGVIGLGLAGVAVGGLLGSGWVSWAKLPFLVLPGTSGGSSQRKVRKHSPSQPSYTPETKILLGASVLSLSAFVVTMLAARTFNVPGVAYAFAVVAGVLARNVPQRGGSLRLEPVTRWLVGLGPALLIAGWLAWVVAPVAIARFKLEQATVRLEQAMLLLEQPDKTERTLQRVDELLADAEAELQRADSANPNSAPIWVETAWLHLEQSMQDPVQFDTFSREAEEAAQRAVSLAPGAAAPRVTLGLAYLINNRVSEAEAQLRQALDVAPNDPYVQYYAVAVLALDPASRAMARQLVEVVENSSYPDRHVRKLQAALAWGANSQVPLDGLRQRPLPPRYVAPEPWPSVEGMPRGTAVAEPPPASTTKLTKPGPAGPDEAPGSVAPAP